MPSLMICHTPLFFFPQPPALAFGAGDNFFHRIFEVQLMNFGLVPARGEQSSLVDRVGEVGAGETWCGLSDAPQINIFRQRLASNMYLEYGDTPVDIRRVNHDLPVEAPRTQQGPIQDIR